MWISEFEYIIAVALKGQFRPVFVQTWLLEQEKNVQMSSAMMQVELRKKLKLPCAYAYFYCCPYLLTFDYYYCLCEILKIKD